MQTFTQQDYKEALEKLPQERQDLLWSDETPSKMETIAKKNDVPESKHELLFTIFDNVLFELAPWRDLAVTIQTELSLPAATATSLAGDFYQQILGANGTNPTSTTEVSPAPPNSTQTEKKATDTPETHLFTNEQTRQRLAQLPPSVQALIETDTMQETIRTTVKSAQLNGVQTAECFEKIGFVLVGLMKTNEFETYVKENLGLKEASVATLVSSLQSNVFAQIRNALIQAIQKRGTVPAPGVSSPRAGTASQQPAPNAGATQQDTTTPTPFSSKQDPYREPAE